MCCFPSYCIFANLLCRSLNLVRATQHNLNTQKKRKFVPRETTRHIQRQCCIVLICNVLNAHTDGWSHQRVGNKNDENIFVFIFNKFEAAVLFHCEPLNPIRDESERIQFNDDLSSV